MAVSSNNRCDIHSLIASKDSTDKFVASFSYDPKDQIIQKKVVISNPQSVCKTCLEKFKSTADDGKTTRLCVNKKVGNLSEEETKSLVSYFLSKNMLDEAVQLTIKAQCIDNIPANIIEGYVDDLIMKNELSEAERIAEMIKDKTNDDLKKQILYKVAQAHIKKKSVHEAKRIVSKLYDYTFQYKINLLIIQEYLNSNQFAEAEEYAQNLPNKIVFLKLISQEYIKRNMLNEAQIVASKISYSRLKEKILVDIALAYIQCEKLEDAEKLIFELNKSSFQLGLMICLFNAYVEKDLKKAEAVANQIDNIEIKESLLKDIVNVYIFKENKEEASRIAKQLSRSQEILENIFSAFVQSSVQEMNEF